MAIKGYLTSGPYAGATVATSPLKKRPNWVATLLEDKGDKRVGDTIDITSDQFRAGPKPEVVLGKRAGKIVELSATLPKTVSRKELLDHLMTTMSQAGLAKSQYQGRNTNKIREADAIGKGGVSTYRSVPDVACRYAEELLDSLIARTKNLMEVLQREDA